MEWRKKKMIIFVFSLLSSSSSLHSYHPLTSRKGYAVAGSSADTNARLVLARSCCYCWLFVEEREETEVEVEKKGSGKEGASSSRRRQRDGKKYDSLLSDAPVLISCGRGAL